VRELCTSRDVRSLDGADALKLNLKPVEGAAHSVYINQQFEHQILPEKCLNLGRTHIRSAVPYLPKTSNVSGRLTLLRPCCKFGVISFDNAVLMHY
jgi:hypothetical protein